MIISKEIEVKINSPTIKYYTEKGYLVKSGDLIKVKVDDLSKGSHAIVKCSCDNCSTEKDMKYKTYLIITNKLTTPYYCNKCNDIKRKESILRVHGVENNFQRKDVKSKIKKTMIENHGVENPSQSIQIQQKKVNNYLEKHGVTNPSLNKDVQYKMKKTIMENYGVTNISQIQKVKDKKSKLLNDKTFKKYSKLINVNEYESISYNDNIYTMNHLCCNNQFYISNKTLYDRNINNNCLCTICYPIGDQKSIKEKELNDYIKSFGIDIIECDKSILSPKELDLYIPSHNLAIEFNGLFWHSEKFKEKKYHLNKSIDCLNKGIHLLHIWEDEWLYKKDIVKSIIKNQLNLIENKIYSRKCIIKEVNNSKLIRKFLDENHIQGYTQSSTKLGLYYNDELVSLMVFSNSRNGFELSRFCNKINTNVIGSASRLFKHFINNYKFEKILSYSDFRLFNGGLYKILGFVNKGLNKPNYFWVKDNERSHHTKYSKTRLHKKGFDVTNKTEVEIMHSRGYYRLWSCGLVKWEYVK